MIWGRLKEVLNQLVEAQKQWEGIYHFHVSSKLVYAVELKIGFVKALNLFPSSRRSSD
jgi:hypothetical protein